LNTLDLTTRKIIPANPDIVFGMWTEPKKIKQWFGPADINCSKVIVDFKVGGDYIIDNLLPNGETLSIFGTYQEIIMDKKLVYSWNTSTTPAPEKVTVLFKDHPLGTEVIVTHQRIMHETIQRQHKKGWDGCLEKLFDYLN